MKHCQLTIAVIGLLAGCTSEQLYNTGQEYQRTQCRNMPDKVSSDNCMEKTNTSYDDYKQETSK